MAKDHAKEEDYMFLGPVSVAMETDECPPPRDAAGCGRDRPRPRARRPSRCPTGAGWS